MAGMEAMQQKFGKLKWADLFAPAIYYAENGVTLNASTAGFFNWRKSFLERTPEGKAFLAAGNTAEYKQGKKFFQPDAAKTLRAVAAQGAQKDRTSVGSGKRVSVRVDRGGRRNI